MSWDRELEYPFFDGVDEDLAICRKRESNPEGLLKRDHILIQIHFIRRWRWLRRNNLKNESSSVESPRTQVRHSSSVEYTAISAPEWRSDQNWRRRTFKSSETGDLLKKRHNRRSRFRECVYEEGTSKCEQKTRRQRKEGKELAVHVSSRGSRFLMEVSSFLFLNMWHVSSPFSTRTKKYGNK